jgi:hypothetical protein
MVPGSLMRRSAAVIVVAGLALGIQGCRNVTASDVIGSWVLDDSSRTWLPSDLRDVQAQLILHANGTFAASGLPGLLDLDDAAHPRRYTGTGSWKLVHREGRQQVWLTFKSIDGWNKGLPYGDVLSISDGWAGPSFDYFLGDPDQGRRIRLRKTR